MQSHEIRKRFLDFFEKRGHAVIPSASLVPKDDPSVLFNTAGMQPLVPYLLGQDHPKGKRLASSQKCVRTVDLDEVGDNTHATFFEMLGNWSLGDYWKKEAIEWSYELLTSKEEGFGLDPNRLYVTVFEGDENAPRDVESVEYWKAVGVPEHRIYFLGADANWWSPGDNGPCGPSSEMFYDLTDDGLGDLMHEEFLKADDEQKLVEIWNDVFMEYEKKDGKVISKLSQKNVDTGSGLERITTVLQGKSNFYATDLFHDAMVKIDELSDAEKVSDHQYSKSARIIADHIRSSVFLIADGVRPSNTDQGYVLRRILRRAIRHADTLALTEEALKHIARVFIAKFANVYLEVKNSSTEIERIIHEEESKFKDALKKGLKEFEKLGKRELTGSAAFHLYQTYGFPLEVIQELADVDVEGFETELQKHSALSSKGADQKFKGGLADTSKASIKYHTATHLLNAALRHVLGDHIQQKGSNITPERLRFDFTHDAKMTPEEKEAVEKWVNDAIQKALPVTFEEMDLDAAREKGAIGVFGEKYDDRVTVYSIGEGDSVVSMEICGGPHVQNTSELGMFKIKKEESSSAGVRRIKAVLE